MNEKELQDLIWANPHLVEEGLEPIGKELRTGNGPADFVFKDKQGKTVIVEAKMNGESKAEPQINRYAAAYSMTRNIPLNEIRRIVFTTEQSEKLEMACQFGHAEYKVLDRIDFKRLSPVQKTKIEHKERIVENKIYVTHWSHDGHKQPLTVSWHDAVIQFNRDISQHIAANVDKTLQKLGLDEIKFVFDDPQRKESNTVRISGFQITAELLPAYLRLIEFLVNSELDKQPLAVFQKSAKIKRLGAKITRQRTFFYFQRFFDDCIPYDVGMTLRRNYFDWIEKGSPAEAAYTQKDPETEAIADNQAGISP